VKGRLLEAIAKLDSLIRSTASARSRLLTRMRSCELMLASSADGDWRPYLAPLLEAVDRHQLEAWEPALALQALSIVYRGLNDDGEPACGLPAKAEILKRIALLDIGRALSISGT
jgi:type VI secretion system protein VasJ